jgi:hypothetical protein
VSLIFPFAYTGFETSIDWPSRLFRYISVVLFITGSYVFWAGGQLSDAECRYLSPVPVALKCAHLFIVDSIL